MKNHIVLFVTFGILFIVATAERPPGYQIKNQVEQEQMILKGYDLDRVIPIKFEQPDGLMAPRYVLRPELLGYSTLETPKTVRQYALVTNPYHARFLRHQVRLC